MCFDDENESVVSAQQETVNEKPIQGKGLTPEQQLKFEMLVAILVAQPMGFGPADKELQDRLELTAESLENYSGYGSRVFTGDNAQTAFEDAVGDVAIALGFFKDTPELGSVKQLASAIRAFVSNLRLALKKGIYDNVAA